MMATPFTLMNWYLYNLGLYNVLRWCALEHEIENIVDKAHVGSLGGQF